MDDDYDDDADVKQTSHHRVAWKDRIGLSLRWKMDLDACSEYYQTDRYPARVECLRNDIININNGPQLQTIVEDYINGELEDWMNKEYIDWWNSNPRDRTDANLVKNIWKDIKYRAYEKIHHFILQMLEDNGFGTYQSTIETDKMQ